MLLKMMSDDPYKLDDNPLKKFVIFDKVLAVDFEQIDLNNGETNADVLSVTFEKGCIPDVGIGYLPTEDWDFDACTFKLHGNAYLMTADGKTVQLFRHISTNEMDRWDQPIESLCLPKPVTDGLKKHIGTFVGQLIRLTEKEISRPCEIIGSEIGQLYSGRASCMSYIDAQECHTTLHNLADILVEQGLRLGTNVGDWEAPYSTIEMKATPLSLGLDSDILNILLMRGVQTVEQLVNMGPKEIYALDSAITDRMIKNIFARLKTCNMIEHMTIDEWQFK